MPINGYVEYKRREFCKDVKCPLQLQLEAQEEGCSEYERIRQTCRTSCRYTAHQFHRWLIENGFSIVKPE